MKLPRESFLHALESVSPGLSPREIVEQSTCLVFRDGQVYSFNDEISCQGKSGLDGSFTGAVRADKLLDLLRKLPEDEIDITQAKGELAIAGKGRKAAFTMESEITLPIDQVDKPGKWRKLPGDFAEAVGMVQNCASTDQSAFALTCVHVHPKHVEAFDGFQTCRWKLDAGVNEPYLVRASSIKHATVLGMAEVSETQSWLHFRNGTGLIVSIRRYVEEYPQDIGRFLAVKDEAGKDIRGVSVQLPKGLKEEAERATLFSSENADSNYLVVEMKQGKVRVKGVGITGRYEAGKKLTWNGPEMQFLISPKLLAEIVAKHSECFMSKSRLLVSGGGWRYAAALGAPAPAAKASQEVEGGEE